MSTSCLAMVGAGPLPEQVMQRFCRSFADRQRSALLIAGIHDDPDAVLTDRTSQEALLCLNGDAGRLLPRGSSWLEALADWRLPTLLLASVDPDGGMPGSAAAHVALCRQLGVPLIGLVQLQGPWDTTARRRDGLPWCGRIPEHDHPQHQDGLDALVDLIIRRQLKGPAARAAV